MGFKVIFAPQALESLGEVVRYIAKDNPTAAEKFCLRLLERAALLADFPEIGQPYPKRPNVRRLGCKPYGISYRLHREKRIVEIMDFWHSARREPYIEQA
jgi:plasmid stabilization system protein ParE